MLRVRIVRGEKLGKRDLFGIADPYVIVKLEGRNGDVIDEVQLDTKRKVSYPVLYLFNTVSKEINSAVWFLKEYLKHDFVEVLIVRMCIALSMK